MITVIGCGSGNANNLTLSGYKAIKSANVLILKTEKMPITALLKEENIPYTTLDGLFDMAEDFDALNLLIKERLETYEDCTYLVHGNALDDTSVKVLENKIIIPGISVGDCAAAFVDACGDTKCFNALEVLSGTLPTAHTDNVITCIDSDLIASDLKCILGNIYGDEADIIYYTEDYCGNQFKKAIKLYQLDMQDEYNHTTSVYLKKVDFCDVYKYDCLHLINVMAKLCSPGGCPWDSVQTHQSLRPYLIEEAYEVADTIDKDDPYRLYDELGDVLLQVVFHADIGARCGEFDFNDITDAITRKMIARHPQIFGDTPADGDINDQWEQMKMQEKGLKSYKEGMEDVPEALPALMRAEKIIHKAEKAGIKSAQPEMIIEKLNALLKKDVLNTEEAWGEFLFNAVQLAKAMGINPELALSKHTLRFIEGFDK